MKKKLRDWNEGKRKMKSDDLFLDVALISSFSNLCWRQKN